MPWAVRRRSPTRSSIGAPITCWCSTQQGVPGGEGVLRAALFRPRRHGQAGVRRLRRQSWPPGRVFVCPQAASLEALRAWPGLRTVLAVETIRSVTGSGKVEAEDPSDIGTNLAFLPATWGTGGRVDGGFAAALEQAWPRISIALDKAPEGRIIYTGHSLGGALTVLASSRRKPSRAYTFGAPRVGDAEF